MEAELKQINQQLWDIEDQIRDKERNMSFNIGLSGLYAANKQLDVTGNNIANVATTGFKSSRAEFADIYAASKLGTGQNSIGNGVNLAAVSQQFTQGDVNGSGGILDMAIQGGGFFVQRKLGVGVKILIGRDQIIKMRVQPTVEHAIGSGGFVGRRRSAGERERRHDAGAQARERRLADGAPRRGALRAGAHAETHHPRHRPAAAVGRAPQRAGVQPRVVHEDAEAARRAPVEFVDYQEPDVVTVALILRARVPETDDQPAHDAALLVRALFGLIFCGLLALLSILVEVERFASGLEAKEVVVVIVERLDALRHGHR